MKLRVKDNESFIRDSENLAILNTDTNMLKKHEQKMAQLNRQKQQQEEINSIRNEVSELKQMMQELLKRL